ncbi:hypothetical protein METY_0120 [Methylopila sp. Yamaguchi]|nr:hypothetical protein METY_0120 [Methylopila sp. Yamaguchi]
MRGLRDARKERAVAAAQGVVSRRMSDRIHRYKVGQHVSLAASAYGRTAAEVEIVRLMPAERDDLEPQYRVKSRGESHERVVGEGMIASPFGAGA